MTTVPKRDSPASDTDFVEAVSRLGTLPLNYFPPSMLRDAFEVARKWRAAVRTEVEYKTAGSISDDDNQ